MSIPASVQTIGHQAFGYLYGQPGNEVTVEGFTVYGYTNSAAQAYAEENGFAFVSLGGNPCANGHEFKNGVCVHCGYAASSASEIFTDVKAGVYYDSAVLWAIRNGITGGMSAAKFGVGKTCTRAQIVTFLYKAYGKETD